VDGLDASTSRHRSLDRYMQHSRQNLKVGEALKLLPICGRKRNERKDCREARQDKALGRIRALTGSDLNDVVSRSRRKLRLLYLLFIK